MLSPSSGLGEWYSKCKTQIDELEAENERLREAMLKAYMKLHGDALLQVGAILSNALKESE